MKFLVKYTVATAILYATLVVYIYHAGVARKPDTLVSAAPAKARWFDKRQLGINHLVLEGAPYARGVKAGELTKHLLKEQEDTLVGMLRQWIPRDWMIQAMVIAAITWFHGVEDYLEPAHLEEMYGTSLSAPREYDFLADGFTRQVAYHGLHEVGQMMVDRGVQDMGCTVVAVPRGRGWVLGRNFDFEGGRIFDREKIVKWVFPDRGHAFVSVIWAGMVGAVTGVNDKGLYASINAAGSDDFRRVGTPSTLVLLKVLQEAATAEEAIRILRESRMFITDIFVVADAQGNLYRVEKSPAKTVSIRLEGPSAVANHLISPQFANDGTNAFRKAELTSLARQERAEALLRPIQAGMDQQSVVESVLAILRDKGIGRDGASLPLGHRRAIDALIATHSVIYDSVMGILYVSQGPAVSGPFKGYDLRQSFRKRLPILRDELPRDPLVSDQEFLEAKNAQAALMKSDFLVRMKKCTVARELLESVPHRFREQSAYYLALGKTQACAFNGVDARISYRKGLSLTPAYAREERELKRRSQ